MPILLLTLQKNVFWCISRVNNAPSDISFYGLFMTVNFEKCIESVKVAECREKAFWSFESILNEVIISQLLCT